MPQCSKDLDASTPLDGSASHPKDGDLTVCLYCHAVLTFIDGAKSLRELSELEIQAMPAAQRDEMRHVRDFIRNRSKKTWWQGFTEHTAKQSRHG